MIAETVRPQLDPGLVNLVHTGQLSGPRGRDPRALLMALRRLRDEQPAVAAKLRIVLAGRSTQARSSFCASSIIKEPLSVWAS